MYSFYSKIAGTTFDGRQDIIEELSDCGMLNSGQSLFLKREPENPYDRNAIAILHPSTMQQLGYIEKNLAAEMAAKMDTGTRYSAEVSQLTGGTGYRYGVNIILYENSNERIPEEQKSEESEKEQNMEDGFMYSNKIYESICRDLDGNFVYEANREEGSIYMSNLKIESTIGKINVLIRVREDDLVIYASPVAFAVDSENILKVGELCLRINEKYLYPTLDIDFSDNTICSKMFFSCGDRHLEEKEFGHYFLSTALHLQKYGNALMAVSLGFQEPLEALESVKED